MRKACILLTLSLLFATSLSAQPGRKRARPPQTATAEPRKYPSLLWEITGNGLRKPSYLFGTMHVSDKLAFHLGDSFYNAIRSVDVVALETNPEYWQDDYSNSVFFGDNEMGGGAYFMQNRNIASDYLNITTFAIDGYDEAIKASLAVEPSMVNGLLYRTYGSKADDFEEDTFLDMYIFQTGKKLGKKLAGVENFEESEKLVMEAYRDMMRDRDRKRRSFDMDDIFANPKKLEEAYRRGDLDLLDSLDALSVSSDAFQEKFLYKRNDIQAASMDTIMRKQTLFAAVGAAHLPGKRGVIEILRRMGYTVRPVKMDDRNSVQKETIEKIHSPSPFVLQTSKDGFYQVAIPGTKFYSFTEWMGIDVKQYADMVNGAYYMVTRVKTNSFYQGHSADMVHRKIDSLLYENIPGRILKKTAISRNGYKGWEILNRTRRGDHQQYQAFITPFEVIVFKVSGNGEYINSGNEAEKFFSSIKLTEYNSGKWEKFQPPTGGFAIDFPHPPSLMQGQHFGSERFEYGASDAMNGNSYLLMKGSIFNFQFAGEDTLDLNLMNESYAYSSFIQKQTSGKFTTLQGYPSLESSFQHKDGSFSAVKYVIQGPHYYVIAARYRTESESAKRFLSSFRITPFIYPDATLRSDSTMAFTVQSPVFPGKTKKDEQQRELIQLFSGYMDEDEEAELGQYSGTGTTEHFKVIGNDTTGEKIYLGYRKPGAYEFRKDSTDIWYSDADAAFDEDSTLIYRIDTSYLTSSGLYCRDQQISDTGSSRLMLIKYVYSKGHVYGLMTLTDTLSPRSSFLSRFFNTFHPADTLKDVSIFTKKTKIFFDDFFSSDSLANRKARRAMSSMKYDSTDVPLLKDAIRRVNWKTKDYLETKKIFIARLGALKDSSITPYLKKLYLAVKDSSDLQNAILYALLAQRTKESFIAFKDLILQETPIGTDDYSLYAERSILSASTQYLDITLPYLNNTSSGWGPLYDTLQLTRAIFPDFVNLMNVDEYKERVLALMKVLVDSSQLKTEDYESSYSKIYLDARQLLKKQQAKEEKVKIEKATLKEKKNSFYEEDYLTEDIGSGNSDLDLYAVLLMPFYDKKPGLPAFYEQLLRSGDRRLRYNTMLLMLRSNKPVPDSLFTAYARLDEYRSELYGDLETMKKLDRFPTTYRNQPAITRSLFFSEKSSYSKPDSVVLIDKLPVTYKGTKGWVYFYKYRQERDDNYWQIATVGMQPEKLDEVSVTNDDFTEQKNIKLEKDVPVKEQMQKLLKECLYSKRPGAAAFYEGRRYNIYKEYLSEMVKRQRYRD